IVTQMGLWLMPAPEHAEMFACFVDDHDAISPVVDALRGLRLDGTVRSIVHIANALRLISSSRSFPWNQSDASSALAESVQKELAREAGVGAWALSGMLTGRRAQVKASKVALIKALKGPGRRLVFLTERKLDVGSYVLSRFGFGQWGRGLHQRLSSAR